MPTEPSKSPGFSQKSKKPDFRRGNTYVLCIGIDAYEKQPLYNCVLDVQTFTRVLVERYDFQQEHIKLLVNEGASRQAVITSLREYAKMVTEDDNFILYYSGHGVLDKTDQEGYWLLHGCDADTYAVDGMANQETLRYIKALKARHIVLFVDSCFSGSLFYANKDVADRAVSDVDALERFRSRWAITAGRNEPVSDGQEGRHSPFAECLIRYLERNDHPEGKFSIATLGQHVKRVLDRNSRQTPDGRPLQAANDEGGEFVFRLKTRSEEQTLYETAVRQRDIRLLEDFLVDFENSVHKAEVKKLLAELEEARDWAHAQRKNTVIAFDNYIDNHPTGLHVAEARQKKREIREQRDREAGAQQAEAERLREQAEADREKAEAADHAAWEKAKKAGKQSDIEGYLKEYPNGLHREEAKKGLDKLKKAFDDGWQRIQYQRAQQDAKEEAEDHQAFREARTLADFEAYLAKGYVLHEKEAREKIAGLKKGEQNKPAATEKKQRDYYAVLGVKTDADAAALKIAFDTKSREIKPGDPDGEYKRNELSEAYKVLSDKALREKYDRYGHAGLEEKTDFQGMNMDEIFKRFGFDSDDIFGEFFNKANSNTGKKGDNLRIKLLVTKKDIQDGFEKKIKLKRLASCTACNATGAEKGAKLTTCGACRGVGKVNRVSQTPFGMMQSTVPCPTCEGSGAIIPHKCPVCSGEGRVEREEIVPIHVSAKDAKQITNDAQFKVAGQGNVGIRGGEPGDLLLTFDVV